jgi:hypothetical protein
MKNCKIIKKYVKCGMKHPERMKQIYQVSEAGPPENIPNLQLVSLVDISNSSFRQLIA